MNCPLCGGEGTLLGKLGLLDWFRCRQCGMEYNQQDEQPIEVDVPQQPQDVPSTTPKEKPK